MPVFGQVGPQDLPPGAFCYPGTGPPIVPGQPGVPSKCTAKLPRPGFFCCSGYGVPSGDVDLAEYDFALEFAALRPLVNGTRALATFDLWSGLLSYHRSIALHQHAGHVLNTAIAAVARLPKAQQKAAATEHCLPLLSNLSRVYEQHLTTLLRLVAEPSLPRCACVPAAASSVHRLGWPCSLSE